MAVMTGPAIAVMPLASIAAQATGTVTGRVTDADNGQPIVAAQVTIAGTTIGRATGDDGRYSLTGLKVGVVTVTVRRIGYAQQTRTITISTSGTVTVDVALAKSSVSLTGVVVTALGEERKKEVGNSVSTVDASQFDKGGVANTQQILQGRSTGVTVLGNSGQPGAGGTIRLRGVNSVTQGNRPLIYVDGVRIFNGNSPTGVSSRQSVSPLNDIAASDIDRIEVVKGPAATTLYGTEASGGVIQIFTKRGRDGAARWNLEASGGINSIGDFGPKSDPTGLFLKQCRGPNLVNIDGVAFEDATCPQSGSWFQQGAVSRYSLGVRGAGGGINYAISGNFENEYGVVRVGNNKTGGLRANIGFTPSKNLTFAINSSYQRRSTAMISDGNSADAFLLNVSRGPGSNFKGTGCSNATVVCTLNDTIFSKANSIANDHFITGGTATWTPLTQLTNRLSVGFDYNDSDIRTVNPFGYLRTPTGQFFQTLWNRTLLSVDYTSTWKQSLGTNFSSSTSIGGQLFESRLNSTDLQADNFAGPGTPTLISGSLRQITDVNAQRVINAGYFVQQQLGWRDKLFVTAGLRVDGNSAFGKSFGLQQYPKLSATYVMSDESWFPTKLVETLKLRAAIGESGKAPGAFDASRTWNPVAAEGGQSAFTPGQLGNPNLGPERTRETEGGLDASFLNGRVGLVLTAFQARTSGALINVTFPPSQGFSNTQPLNAGTLQSTGLEAQLTATLHPTSWAELELRAQYTSVKSTAINLGGQVLTLDALARSYVKEGLPVPAYLGFKVRNASEFATPIIDTLQFLGGTFPTQIINPSFTLTLFKRLNIDAVGEWQIGGHLLNGTAFQNAGLQIWQPCFTAQRALKAAAAGNTAALATVTAGDRIKCSITASERDYSYFVERSDFFKLRSVSVSYELPKSILRSSRPTTIQFTGRNLLRVTNYSGSDPENADQRTSSFYRREYYNFPPYRTFLFSVRTSF